MTNIDLIQKLLHIPMEIEVTISTDAIVNDDSSELFLPELVKEVYTVETDDKKIIIVIQS